MDIETPFYMFYRFPKVGIVRYKIPQPYKGPNNLNIWVRPKVGGIKSQRHLF